MTTHVCVCDAPRSSDHRARSLFTAAARVGLAPTADPLCMRAIADGARRKNGRLRARGWNTFCQAAATAAFASCPSASINQAVCDFFAGAFS